MKVSLFELNYEKNELFHDILIFWHLSNGMSLCLYSSIHPCIELWLDKHLDTPSSATWVISIFVLFSKKIMSKVQLCDQWISCRLNVDVEPCVGGGPLRYATLAWFPPTSRASSMTLATFQSFSLDHMTITG